MLLSNTSSIAQHLKKHSCPTKELRKILTESTTILEHQNNKLEALHIRNIQPNLIKSLKKCRQNTHILKFSLINYWILLNERKNCSEILLYITYFTRYFMFLHGEIWVSPFALSTKQTEKLVEHRTEWFVSQTHKLAV